MSLRRMCSAASTNNAVAIIGGAAFVGGVSLDLSDMGAAIRQIGALLLIGVIVKNCIRPAAMPVAEAFKCGHEQGYNLGHTDGHREARPVVVPIHLYRDPHWPEASSN